MDTTARGPFAHAVHAVRRRGPAVLLVAALSFAALSFAPSSETQARAQDAAYTKEELGLAIVAGFGGVAPHRGTWTPVEVALEPTRIVAGTLTVTANSGGASTVERREVEVAAGAHKVFRFVVPPADDLVVSFSSVDRSPLTLRLNPPQDGAAFAVGVLDADPPRNAPPVVGYGTALRGAYARVDGAWLERSPRSMEELGTLVASRQALEALSDTGRRNLVTAVAGGLELVIEIEDAAGADLSTLGLPWLPATGAAARAIDVVRGANGVATPETVAVIVPSADAWGMTAADVLPGSEAAVIAAAMTAGRGRIAVVGVPLGTGVLGTSGEVWQHLLQPSVTLSDGFGDSGRDLYVAQEAIRDPSLSVPSIPGLTIFLIAFVLIVGPINGFILRRRNKVELAWVTIPAITLAFAAVSFLSATRSAPATGLTGVAAWWLDGVGTEVQGTIVRAPNPGSHQVVLPGEGWDVRNGSFNRPASVDRSSGDTRVDFQLESLELGSMLATRPTQVVPPLTLTTTVGPDGIVATVTNTSTETVSDVWVRAATSRRRVGDLEAGASETITITANAGTIPVVNAWNEQFEGLRDANGRPIPPRALEELLRWTVLDGNPGIVWVTGTIATAGDLVTLPLADSSTPNDVGALVAVGSTLRGPEMALTPFGAQRTLLGENRFGSVYRPSATSVEGQGEMVLRYRLPAAEITTLASSLDRGMLENGFGGGGEGPVECFESDGVGPDGAPRPREVCIEVGIPQTDDACPPEADRCFITRSRIEICRSDQNGNQTCEQSPNQDAPGQTKGLEVFDLRAKVWVPVGLAFPGGTADAGPYLSPLGEVLVRVTGEFHPFDFSGRGLASSTTEAAA